MCIIRLHKSKSCEFMADSKAETVKKIQGFVPIEVFREFKQKALELDVSMQSAIEEAVGDWLRKYSSDEKPATGVFGLLDEIEKLIRRVREASRG